MPLFAYFSPSQVFIDRRAAVVCFFVWTTLISHFPVALGLAPQKDDKETESVVVAFDELKADGILGNPIGRYASDAYRTQHGLWIGTCQLMGRPVVGEEVQLTDPLAAWEILGGADQPFVSPFNMIVAAGGGNRDLLLSFEKPVYSVSICSDRFPEGPDRIRLIILQPMESKQRSVRTQAEAMRIASARVLAIDEKIDHFMKKPENMLSVSLKGEPFQHVLIECTTEQEAFDDLTFTRKRTTPSTETSWLFRWLDDPASDLLIGRRTFDANRLCVNLADRKIADSDLRVLQKMVNLYSLDLSGTDISDDGLLELKDMTSLHRLNLRGTQISRRGLQSLQALTELRDLNVRASRIEDEKVQSFEPHMQRLRNSLQRPFLTDSSMKYVSNFKNLEKLDLSANLISDSGISELTKLEKLERLILSHLPITNAAVKSLTALENLQELDLYGSKIDDEGLNQLAAMKNLRWVRIGPPATKAGAELARQRMPHCGVEYVDKR